MEENIMKSVKREELQGATINGLKNLLDDVNRKIVESELLGN